MKHLFCLLLTAATLHAAAQKSKPPVVYQKAISISPLALLDVDHTLMLTGEYRFNKKMALVADAGYIFASEYTSNIEKTSGFNIRPSIQMYYGRRNKGYLQGQVFYKRATYTLHDWVGKDCVEGVPSYEQEMDFKYRKQVMGFNFIAGGVLPLSRSQRWLMDLYGGLGFRYKTHQLIDMPNSCYQVSGGWVLNIFDDEVTTISVPMGMRITYVLK